ncbi:MULTISPECIES: IS110 family transposase [Paraburkholderia]|jgi:transposase|uniref:Transposase n=1 Tax=Paraburkholderia graminis TaxID=60548 RepID=A0ABD5CF17_9BURK|nr:IS110 family transposase [Paraburkholderia graminis]MDQ0621886.1 transposase [Paraburkholderia graminis]MDR6203891.1 transposase [Paraburkholderia graminis]
MKHTIVGVDIAKNVMQVHWVDADSGEIVNKPIKRAVFLEYFVNRPPCLVGMESCGGSQHWARRLIEMGHQVKLMPAKFVKAFVTGNKNDAADARAIWMATQMPSKEVAVKTEAQQAVLALHRMRQQLVKFRTMQINSLRGLLTEYGEVMGTGRAALDRAIAGVLERLSGRLPAILIDTLREQWNGLEALDQQIAQIERRLQAWMKQDDASKAIAAIPGVGLLSATAAVATMGHAKSFRSGREFAAWLGLVPGQTGSGGKVELLGISKRGDRYLRTLLIHGARSVIFHAKDAGAWLEQLKKRRPLNVVVVALANKMARTIWAMLAHQRPYQKDYGSVPPAPAR